jgi:hypothetical protein
MASIDGVVAFVLFLIFVSWSFVYFSTILSVEAANPLEGTIKSVSDNIVEYLTVDAYEMPVRHNSNSNVTDAVFYFDYVWPSEGAKNSTKVYNNIGDPVFCNITGNTIFWMADADAGFNYFTITYSNKNVTLNCSDGDLGNPINKTIPWSAVRKRKVSQERINDMVNTGHESFKTKLGIERDFRVEMNVSGSITVYGMSPPNATSVYTKTTLHATENNQQAEIKVLIW